MVCIPPGTGMGVNGHPPRFFWLLFLLSQVLLLVCLLGQLLASSTISCMASHPPVPVSSLVPGVSSCQSFPFQPLPPLPIV